MNGSGRQTNASLAPCCRLQAAAQPSLFRPRPASTLPLSTGVRRTRPTIIFSFMVDRSMEPVSFPFTTTHCHSLDVSPRMRCTCAPSRTGASIRDGPSPSPFTSAYLRRRAIVRAESSGAGPWRAQRCLLAGQHGAGVLRRARRALLACSGVMASYWRARRTRAEPSRAAPPNYATPRRTRFCPSTDGVAWRGVATRPQPGAEESSKKRRTRGMGETGRDRMKGGGKGESARTTVGHGEGGRGEGERRLRAYLGWRRGRGTQRLGSHRHGGGAGVGVGGGGVDGGKIDGGRLGAGRGGRGRKRP